MEKTITIDDKPVRFVNNGGTLLRYRSTFKRGIIEDANTLVTKAQTGIDDEALDILYRLAYVMAKQGDPSIGEFTEWFDQFEMMSILNAMPEIIALWTETSTPTVTAKKK